MATAAVPIEIRGRYFWRGEERFLIRGIVYQDYDHRRPSTTDRQEGPNDAIADDRLEQLEHDIGLFKELGLNAIFVFSIDSTKCHDKAMTMLEEAGIYVLATVSTPRIAINRLRPFDSYTAESMSHFFRAADTLAKYPNCLGILAGNGVLNSRRNVLAAPVIRAVVRDLKRYLRLKHEATGERILPVGYSAADVRELEKPTREYLAAGDEASRIDFWSKNDFSWASPSDMQSSGYNMQVKQYSNFNIPTFWSEYGSNCNAPRDFGETAALCSPAMTRVFSGGFAYEFWRGANDFGIVRKITGNEAAKWRVAHNRLQQISADGMGEDAAKTSSVEYVDIAEAIGRQHSDDHGRPAILGKTIAEYRATSIGEIVLYKDFVNLKKRFEATEDVTLNTDPDWTDSSVTVSRAPAWPVEGPFGGVVGEGNVPDTCVDWQELEEKIRDDDYVLVADDHEPGEVQSGQ